LDCSRRRTSCCDRWIQVDMLSTKIICSILNKEFVLRICEHMQALKLCLLILATSLLHLSGYAELHIWVLTYVIKARLIEEIHAYWLQFFTLFFSWLLLVSYIRVLFCNTWGKLHIFPKTCQMYMKVFTYQFHVSLRRPKYAWEFLLNLLLKIILNHITSYFQVLCFGPCLSWHHLLQLWEAKQLYLQPSLLLSSAFLWDAFPEWRLCIHQGGSMARFTYLR
jgi:hypothetical protein